MTGPYETEAEARQAAGQQPVNPKWPPTAANQRMLLDACAAAGVRVGAYDHRIIEWLANYEPATCAVIAGLIRRAHEGGAS